MRRVRLLLVGLVVPFIGYPLSASAQVEPWSFEGRPYYDPLISGVRDANISALALGWADRMDYMVQDNALRRIWDIDVGVELPLVGWEAVSKAGAEWGFGIWLPIDFHMIEDFVDDSNPIINTDYRFGVMLKAQLVPAGIHRFATRIFVGHESTHLGDEFSIAGQRAHVDTFERINVSWEFFDFGMLWEAQPVATRRTWGVRAGFTGSIRSSYYSTDDGSLTESPLGDVVASSNKVDPYLGLELEQDGLFTMRRNGPRWGLYVSSEIRWRSIYDYHRANASVSENRQASVNLIGGILKVGRPRVSPFVRVYHGVNPHGQFRNQKDFTLYGIGLRLIP